MHSVFESDARQVDEIRAIHDALGAISAAKPMVCWVYLGEDGDWWVRREGDPDERSFPSREPALTAAQVSVVRCASYCLYVQGLDGRVTRSQFNWLPRRGGGHPASDC